MYEETDEEVRFKTYHDSLRRELNNANWHFTVFEHLDKLRGEYKEEMLEALEFWGLTQRSHFLDTIMRLNKICDNDPDTINIHKLLNYAEQNIEIFSDESFERRQHDSVNYEIAMVMHGKNPNKIDQEYLAKSREKFAAILDTNLKKLRDKAIAHIDKEVVVKGILPFKEYQVDPSEIESIINELHATLNILSIAYDGTQYVIHLAGLDKSMLHIMDLMRLGLKERKKQIGGD